MCDGPEEPPPGRFGFKKHAGLIRVKGTVHENLKKKSYGLYCYAMARHFYQPVPGSIKLYKVDNHYENVMGSMKSS